MKSNGLWRTRAYTSWATMMKSSDVDSRWLEFANFYADMGERPAGKYLVRIDRTQGFSKENCRWGSWSDRQNTLSSNVVIEFDGRAQTLKQWSDELDLNWRTLWNRLFRSPAWTVQDAFSTPARPRRS